MVSRIDTWRRCLIRILAISKWRPLQSGKEGSRRDVDANGKSSRCRIPGREVVFEGIVQDYTESIAGYTHQVE